MVPAAASSRDLTSKSRAWPAARSERSSGSDTLGTVEGTQSLEGRPGAAPQARRGLPPASHLGGNACTAATPPPAPFPAPGSLLPVPCSPRARRKADS